MDQKCFEDSKAFDCQTLTTQFAQQPTMDDRPSFVPYTTCDRQWDARFNVQDDDYLEQLVKNIKADWESGRLRYILIGGPEIGTRPYQQDYGIRHVHVAAMFHNRVSKSSILKSWGIKEGNGYYLVPRNRSLPYSGWRTHHIKEFSKIDTSNLIIFEAGELPIDEKRTRPQESEEEKKRKINDILIDLNGLIEEGKEDEAFRKYPRTFLQYGEKIKARITQKRDTSPDSGDPHIWLYGTPGTGKTQILALVYPDYYKKNLSNKFFDLYNPDVNKHMILEDLDHEAVERLGINFIKTLCDETGFPIDQKYKTPQLAKTKVLVTSNFTIPEILKDTNGIEANKRALLRRFFHVNIFEFLRILGVKLIPKPERDALKKEGNNDTSKLFIGWHYATDTPTGQPLKSPEEYQEMIKEVYYT